MTILGLFFRADFFTCIIELRRSNLADREEEDLINAQSD